MVIEENRKASEFLDRVAILGGPAAILASFTFIKDIAQKPTGYSLLALLCSWIVFILGSGFGLMAQRAKRETADVYENLLDDKLKLGDPEWREGDFDGVRPLNDVTKSWLNWALVAFVLGVALLVIFAGTSLVSTRLQSNTTSASPFSAGTAVAPPIDTAAIRLFTTACQNSGCFLMYNPRPGEVVQAAPVEKRRLKQDSLDTRTQGALSPRPEADLRIVDSAGVGIRKHK